MAPTRFVLPLLVVLGAGGCAKHGIDAVKEMRARACAGDAAGFFNHVDREGFARATRAYREQRAEAKIAQLAPAEQVAAREKFSKNVDENVQTAVNDTFTAWQYDIKQGPAGELCRMSIMESSEVDGTADVHVKSISMGDQQWTMARSGDRWSLVRIRN
jgi:hypothetical protein